jgi:putative SOS response-associated peptidase YedK
MCGRFVASRPVEDIAALLDVDDIEVPEELLQPRFNISPQAGVLAVANRRAKRAAGDEPGADAPGDPLLRRRLTVYRWGLVPSWAKDPTVGNRSFNARAETLAERPAFRTALAKRRCLLPADAFYEWEKALSRSGGGSTGRSPKAPPKGGARLPWCFRPADGGFMVFAALWEAWRAPSAGTAAAGDRLDQHQHHTETDGWHDDWLLSCSIITTSANDVVATIHDRMPVVLMAEDWATWLEPSPVDPAELGALLSPPPEGYLTGYRVGAEVNNSRLDEPSMVEPLTVEVTDPPGHESPSLFDLPG